jgi:hypothetical protein
MAEAEYWRFTVARDCQKKNTLENHSGYRLITVGEMARWRDGEMAGGCRRRDAALAVGVPWLWIA